MEVSAQSDSPEKTEALGAALAGQLQAGDVIALTGEIGAGKTTFVRGVADGLAVPKRTVASPSFVLVREYSGRLPLFHADLYRLEGMPEAATVGLEEYYEREGVTLIEWATQIPDILPEAYLEVQFEVPTPDTRILRLVPHGQRYEGRHFEETL